MNNFKDIVLKFTKLGTLPALLTMALISGILIVAPQKINVAKSENCANAPTVATLNFFPVSWGSTAGYGCTDFAPIAVRNLNESGYVANDYGNIGDELYVRIYVHNAAQQGLNPEQTTAYGVNGSFSIVGNSINTSFSGTRANGSLTNIVTGSVSVELPDGAHLEIVPGSGQFFDYQANPISGNQNLGLTSGSFDMGEMRGCFEFSKFYRFKVKVVGSSTPPPVINIPTGQISATPAVKVSGQCLFKTTVTWSTQNVSSAVVEVTDTLDNVTNIVGYNLNDTTSDTAWMNPNRTYRFTLYNTSNGKTKLAHADVVTGSCGVTPPPVCIVNTNYFLNAATPVKQGSYYSVRLTWGSDGDNQIKITQVNSNGTETTLTTGGKNGNFTTSANLQAGNTYTFKMYDINPDCGKFLTSTQVVIQSSPSQLVCSADSSSYNIGQPATFRATGGTAPYIWTGNGQSFTGAVFSTAYTTSGNKNVTVFSHDGQTANCSTYINQPVVEKGIVGLIKEVRNVTGNETVFSNTTAAKQNDVVEYRIKVSANSSVSLKNVVVTDTFASGLSYVEGSLKVDGQSRASGLTSGGLTFASVNQTPLIITYRAKITATMGSIINTAQASAQNANNVANDQAMVNVSYVNPGQPSLSITKQVKNVTQNTSYSTSVSAKKNDSVKYQVVIKNIGQATAKNVYFNDSNPSQVQPLTNITVVGKTFTGGIPQGIFIGDLPSGQTVTVTYEGIVKVESGTVVNVATVSADNATSQNASAIVAVSAGTNNNESGSYNYCVNYSCNTTNTTNNTTNTTNNTTNTNNNYSYVYINYAGNTVPANQYSQLGVLKSVRLANSGAYQNSITVNNNDTVEFEIVVTNTGNQNINNVRLTDNLTNGLSIVSGSIRVDGSYVSDSNLYSGMYLGNLSAGSQKRVSFQARVNSNTNAGIQNIAVASGDNTASVQDDAWVFVNTGSVQGGSVNLTYSKRAVNETKNQDATMVNASKEDYIIYTLTVSNNGNAPANSFVITDDLSQVLPYADMVDNGGGTVSGNIISFPGITVPAYGSVSKSFKVRIKYSLADNLSYVMTNVYGNSISVRINTPQVLGTFVAPKTGASTGAFVFSGLFTAASALIARRKQIIKLIFT